MLRVDSKSCLVNDLYSVWPTTTYTITREYQTSCKLGDAHSDNITKHVTSKFRRMLACPECGSSCIGHVGFESKGTGNRCEIRVCKCYPTYNTFPLQTAPQTLQEDVQLRGIVTLPQWCLVKSGVHRDYWRKQQRRPFARQHFMQLAFWTLAEYECSYRISKDYLTKYNDLVISTERYFWTLNFSKTWCGKNLESVP